MVQMSRFVGLSDEYMPIDYRGREAPSKPIAPKIRKPKARKPKKEKPAKIFSKATAQEIENMIDFDEIEII